ncbi:ribose-phosphate pyrophosphokinase, partial [Halomonas sp. MG34]|nr:ribose-phosphate pyrophosphokinase [Halomonas sp. MG34]
MASTYKDSSLKVFSLNSNLKLAEDIANHIGTTLGKCSVTRFSDGE